MMLDELLGRAGLKERIAELEGELEELREERDRLQEQLSSANRRRKEAVRNHQDAAERINRLQDRIAQLEGEIDRLGSEHVELSYRGRERLHRPAIEDVLARLESFSAPSEGALTAAITGATPPEIAEVFDERSGLVDRAAPCVAIADDRGLISVALSPPVQPEPFVTWDETFQFEESWFLPTGSFALAVVRSDLFALGEYRGDERLSFQGFESDVHGEHSKGGFSQARFERRRDEQIANHLDRCREALADRSVDRLYLVGDREAIDELDVAAAATATVDATGKPKDALNDAFRTFWTTTMYLI